MKKKRILSATAAVLLAVATPISSMAATWDIGNGDITVNAKVEGQTVTQGEQVDVPDKEPVITGTTDEYNLTINAEEDATANVTLSDVTIDRSATENPDWTPADSYDDYYSDKGDVAISTNGEGDVNIELDGTNSVESGATHAGLEKNNSGELTITDDNDTSGKLTAVGGSGGAGIGGGLTKDGSNITITGGTIGATGGDCAAGIGGGGESAKRKEDWSGYEYFINGSNGENITISGGDVSATGGGPYGSAGIGNGDYGESKNIVISGGVVYTRADDNSRSGNSIGYYRDSEGINNYSALTVSGDAQVYVLGLKEDPTEEQLENLKEGNFIAYYEFFGESSDETLHEGLQNITKVIYKDYDGNIVTCTDNIDVIYKEGTCEEDGFFGFTCNGLYFQYNRYKNDSFLKATGHSYDDGVVTTEPTCTEAGVKTYTCKNDASHTYTEEIPALGHTAVTDEAVAPTCESTGLTEGSHCSVCGEVIIAQETVEALGHAYDDGVVTTEATCTENGVKTFTCANDASHTYTEEIPALGHTVVTDEAVDATCENSGLTEGTHCSVCGEVLTAQETVEALGHKWSKWTVSKEATSTENGEKVKTCSVCGQQQTKVIPATAIVPEDTTVVNNATTNTTVNAKAYDGSTPKTGDNSNIALWVSAFALSLAGVLVVVRKKFRRVK